MRITRRITMRITMRIIRCITMRITMCIIMRIIRCITMRIIMRITMRITRDVLSGLDVVKGVPPVTFGRLAKGPPLAFAAKNCRKGELVKLE
jgi:hypothetical protein